MITNQYINNKLISPASKSEMDISVLATFENDSVQANITTDSFEYILEAYQEIKNHIDTGKIFEPLLYKIEGSDGNNNATVFDGFIKLYQDHLIDNEKLQINAQIEKKDGLNNLYEQLNSIDYRFLLDKGAIQTSDYVDFEYVIEAQDGLIDQLFVAFQIFSLAATIVDNIYKIADAASTVAGLVAAIPGGPIGAAIVAAAQLIFIAAYTAAMVVLLYNLSNQLLAFYAKPKRIAKTMTLHNLIEKPLNYLGYEFNSSIPELQSYLFVPSNIGTDVYDNLGFLKTPKGPEQGFPNIRDVGYSCLEMFTIIRDKIFGAKVAIINNTVELHKENSPFWYKQANFKPKSMLEQPFRYNTEDAKAIINIKFTTDSSDYFNIDEFLGTTYSIFTESFSKPNNVKERLELSIPWALASRKDSLTGFERFLGNLFSSLDDVIDIFGGNSNFASKYTNKIGVMKVSTNNWEVPKLVYVQGGKMPSNHRDKLSAKYLWENYQNTKSFIANNYWKQRKIYENIEIPFSLSNFLNVVNNSYFYTIDGEKAKILSCEWVMNQDKAKISYWVQSRYTQRLEESYYEAE